VMQQFHQIVSLPVLFRRTSVTDVRIWPVSDR
jgi:hypothetical protein